MSKKITISNISEYVESVCKLNADIDKSPRFRAEELLFRGQSNTSYELLPGIARGRDYVCSCTIFNEERNLIEMAKFKMPDVFCNDQTPLELLALLQHYGIPTRLLDVTENALVALYFACCSGFDVDGEVIVFKHHSMHIDNNPLANPIADSYRFASNGAISLDNFYRYIKNQPYFLEYKERCDSFKDNIEWIQQCCQNIFYVYAPVRSLRQRAQQGRYILFPNRIYYETYKDDDFEKTIDPIPKDHKGSTFENIIDPIPKDHEDITMRIIIPKENKEALINDLSILGVSEEVLFGDSIDTVCKGIVNTFKKRC